MLSFFKKGADGEKSGHGKLWLVVIAAVCISVLVYRRLKK